MAISAKLEAQLNEAAAKHGVDPALLKRIVQIESGGNPLAQTGSYRGLGQFSNAEWSKYGGGGNIWDADANANALAAKIAAESKSFESKTGRAPAAIDVYMQHQQGPAGSLAHASNPEGVAWQNVAKYYPSEAIAKKAIWGNIPDSPKESPNFNKTMFPGGVDTVTSGAFTGGWNQKLGLGGGAMAPTAAAASANAQAQRGGAPLASAAGGAGSPGQAGSPVAGAGASAPASAAAASPGALSAPMDTSALSQEMLKQGFSGSNTPGLGTTLGKMAQILSGAILQHQAHSAQTDYSKKMAELLSGAKSPEEMGRAMIASGNPALVTKGAELVATSTGPKSAPTITPGKKNAYGQQITPDTIWDGHAFVPVPGQPALAGQPSTATPATAASAGGAGSPGQTTGPAPVSLPEAAKLASGATTATTAPSAGAAAAPGGVVEPAPAQGATPAAATAPAAALPAGTHVGPPVEHVPADHVQKLAPDGSGFLYDAQGAPILENKSAVDTREKLAEKTAQTKAEATQQVQGVSGVISDARKLAQTPGFEDALKVNQRHFGAHIPSPWGTVDANLMEGPNALARAYDPKNPVWAARDEIAATQQRLNLLVARPLMKGQGQVTESERSSISDAIGNLSNATSPADYQFKLNSVQRMINDMNAGTGVKADVAGATSRPSTAEVMDTINQKAGTFDTNKVIKLADKYNTHPIEMQDYIVDFAKRGAVGTGATPSETAAQAPAQPPAVEPVAPAAAAPVQPPAAVAPPPSSPVQPVIDMLKSVPAGQGASARTPPGQTAGLPQADVFSSVPVAQQQMQTPNTYSGYDALIRALLGQGVNVNQPPQ